MAGSDFCIPSFIAVDDTGKRPLIAPLINAIDK